MKTERTVLENIQSAAFDKQTAAYKGHKKVMDVSQARLEVALRKANGLGVQPVDINRNELLGKARAANDDCATSDFETYQSLLDDL